ncbi:DUF1697 domain-containing protein [Agreia sp. COWG]|uniref:DUF1697 domain-containing protein n=1 Tax=Agreia sp. COWG TaxID=2773266 RepID=UPI0019277C03|nr:DUF1697 domain-containing protein [Agreia sp. COWG]CAD5995893.1 conserved protein of unknown function [Agreia sp. COWG]
MTTSVALVRGINVGPSTLVPMADFAVLLRDEGFTSVKTLLRSGNAVFDSPVPLDTEAVASLESRFASVTGVSASFVVLEARQFVSVVEENPLVAQSDNPSRLMIAFLDGAAPVGANIDMPDAAALLPEVVYVGSRAVYAWCPFGVTDSKIPARFWKQFGPRATVRNANTANKLVSLVLPRLEA